MSNGFYEVSSAICRFARRHNQEEEEDRLLHPAAQLLTCFLSQTAQQLETMLQNHHSHFDEKQKQHFKKSMYITILKRFKTVDKQVNSNSSVQLFIEVYY